MKSNDSFKGISFTERDLNTEDKKQEEMLEFFAMMI